MDRLNVFLKEATVGELLAWCNCDLGTGITILIIDYKVNNIRQRKLPSKTKY